MNQRFSLLLLLVLECLFENNTWSRNFSQISYISKKMQSSYSNFLSFQFAFVCLMARASTSTSTRHSSLILRRHLILSLFPSYTLSNSNPSQQQEVQDQDKTQEKED